MHSTPPHPPQEWFNDDSPDGPDGRAADRRHANGCPAPPPLAPQGDHRLALPRARPDRARDLHRLADGPGGVPVVHGLQPHRRGGMGRTRQLRPSCSATPTFSMPSATRCTTRSSSRRSRSASHWRSLVFIDRRFRSVRSCARRSSCRSSCRSAVAAFAWAYLIDPQVGLLNYWLSQARHPPGQRARETRVLAMPAVVLVAVWKNFGFYMVIFLAGLQDIPEDLYEAARLDGAGRLAALPQRDGAPAVEHVRVRAHLRADRGAAGLRPDLRDDQRRALRPHRRPS